MMRRFVPLVILALVVVAAFVFVVSPGLTQTDRFPVAAAPVIAPNAQGGVTTNPTPIPSNIDLSSVSSPRVLAWNPNTAQLAWYDTKGNSVAIGKAATNKAIVI